MTCNRKFYGITRQEDARKIRWLELPKVKGNILQATPYLESQNNDRPFHI